MTNKSHVNITSSEEMDQIPQKWEHIWTFNLISVSIISLQVKLTLDLNRFGFWFADMTNVSTRFGGFKGGQDSIVFGHWQRIISWDVSIGSKLSCGVNTVWKLVPLVFLSHLTNINIEIHSYHTNMILIAL